jgi:DNA-binding Xre family transcriptional regulator
MEQTLQKIRDALADRTLSRVSRATGISQPTLAKLRDGKGPHRNPVLSKICLYLDIDYHGNTTRAQP